MQVHDEEIHGSKDQEGYAEVEYLTSESGDELIYHVDYHGVTTHPYPAPKHPIQKKKKKKAATRPLKSDAPSSPIAVCCLQTTSPTTVILTNTMFFPENAA
ncbi:hypothetical protein Dimus_002373 [Dionaea muscipula]